MGSQIVGSLQFRLTMNTLPGDGVIRARLSNVTR